MPSALAHFGIHSRAPRKRRTTIYVGVFSPSAIAYFSNRKPVQIVIVKVGVLLRAGVVMAAFFHCGWVIYLWFIFNVVCTEVWHSGGLAVRVQSGPWGLEIKMYQLKELQTTEQRCRH